MRVRLGQATAGDAQGETCGASAETVGDKRRKTTPALTGTGKNRGYEGMIGRTGCDGRSRGHHVFEHEGGNVTEIVTPVHESWHGRAAGVKHEADTRGTKVEKRDNYSLTGIEAAFRAASVLS